MPGGGHGDHWQPAPAAVRDHNARGRAGSHSRPDQGAVCEQGAGVSARRLVRVGRQRQLVRHVRQRGGRAARPRPPQGRGPGVHGQADQGAHQDPLTRRRNKNRYNTRQST